MASPYINKTRPHFQKAEVGHMDAQTMWLQFITIY